MIIRSLWRIQMSFYHVSGWEEVENIFSPSTVFIQHTNSNFLFLGEMLPFATSTNTSNLSSPAFYISVVYRMPIDTRYLQPAATPLHVASTGPLATSPISLVCIFSQYLLKPSPFCLAQSWHKAYVELAGIAEST